MPINRRDFVRSLTCVASHLGIRRPHAGAAALKTEKTYDVAVIGAGVFGAWIAYRLQQAGRSVVVLDAYGPGNSRASSGGESRVIRMGYGADEIYTRWSIRSLEMWKSFFDQIHQKLFHPTGVLWMARDGDEYASKTIAMLEKLSVPFEKMSRPELEKRYPQISFGPVTWGLLEPKSGALMARRCVLAVAEQAVALGATYLTEAVETPRAKGRLTAVKTRSGNSISAGAFVFACGPWLPKIFPELLANRIYPTRQEVLFFGPPVGNSQFTYPAMPVWIDFGDEVYGVPDLENRGFKIALDRHGPHFDADSGNRLVGSESVEAMRKILARRFPGLSNAPLVEARVCQYENTSNGDFLIDRHPDLENVWLVGGGSGHGFKHGPALGEYVSTKLDGGEVDARFTLAIKDKVQKRSVY
jgi:sarcosine oxidase